MKFSVLVIGPDNFVDLVKVLRPYKLHTDFPPYIKYTRKEKAVERKKLLKYWRKQLRLTPLDIGIFNKVVELEEIDDEQYFLNSTKFHDSSELTENGEPISTYNPNSRYSDWEYDKRLGVRLEQTMKAGILASALRKKDVAWKYMSEVNYRMARSDWVTMFDPSLGKPTPSERLKYDYWDGETKEQYLDRQRMFLTHAYILNGKWYERGKIGWWPLDLHLMDRDKWLAQYEKMLTQVKPDTILTAIECTI